MSQLRDSGRLAKPREREAQTDGIDLSAITESGLTQSVDSTARNALRGTGREGLEANVILIAHPDGKRLGSRFRLSPGSSLEIGRSPSVSMSLPEVLSLSRNHARLAYVGGMVLLEDLGSTNGTYLNGRLISGAESLKSGDRFQVGAVHFKFLRELDVEHAYYDAIYELVTRDGLTDVFNKRKFQEESDREVARARRHHRPLSLIVFDVDDFKGINDGYGHLCGDFVLKKVVTVMGELLRPEQIFARVGGDEFVILTPEATVDDANVLAEKLRERVANMAYRYGGSPIPVTCSFGVAELDDEMTGSEALYEAADRALYEAKRAGRNRVSLHTTAG